MLPAATSEEAVAETPATLAPAWQDIADVFEGESLDLVRELAALGVPVPEAGHEVDDGEYVIDLAWPDRRIAVSVEDRRRARRLAGRPRLDGRTARDARRYVRRWKERR